MAQRISGFFQRISKGWVVILFLLIMILFMVFVLPGQAEQAQKFAGKSPDTSFFYKPGELFSIADSYGAEGRQAYIYNRWTFDFIFPLVYVGFLVTGISWYLKDQKEGKVQHLNLVPLIAGAFDYLENSAASIVMALYPKECYPAAVLSSGFSLVKWILVFGSFVIYFLALAYYFLKLIRGFQNKV